MKESNKEYTVLVPNTNTNMDRIYYKELINELSNYYVESKKPYYEIVKDEIELQKFIDFLPDLEPNEKYYYSLFARKKYNGTEGLKSDKAQLKRGTTTKERMLRDFRKLEVKMGCYEIDGLKINQESLVLYITPNPRDMHKAALNTAKQIVTDMANNRPLKSPQAIALNEIQTAGVKKYFNIDVDFKRWDVMDRLEVRFDIESKLNLNLDCLTFINTRGGFHVLVELGKIKDEYRKSWYRQFSEMKSDLFDVDMGNGDGMLPVCGCVQSDYVPNILI